MFRTITCTMMLTVLKGLQVQSLAVPGMKHPMLLQFPFLMGKCNEQKDFPTQIITEHGHIMCSCLTY